ncbi:MAG: tetratricopeptide repeat protein [Myxococcota bacterium]
MKRIALVALVCNLAAADDAGKAKALELLREGLDAYGRSDFAGALGQFEEAFRSFPSVKLLVNIGACHRELGRPEVALDFYDRFLREAGPDAAELRAVAERDAEALRDRVGEILAQGPAGARVAIDGRVVGALPLAAVRVAAGEHDVEVGPHRERVRVAGRGRVTVREPEASSPIAPAPALLSAEPSVSPAATPPPAAETRTGDDPTERRGLFYTWFAAGTAAALAAGALFWWEAELGREASVDVGVGPGSASVGGRF